MPCASLSALESRTIDSTHSGSALVTHDGTIVALAIAGTILFLALIAYAIRSYKTRKVEAPPSGRVSPTLKSFLHGREMYSPKMDDKLGSVSPPDLLFGTGAFALKDPVIGNVANFEMDDEPYSPDMYNEVRSTLGDASAVEGPTSNPVSPVCVTDNEK